MLTHTLSPARGHRTGKYLESAAKGRTSSAIGALLRLAPATAILCHTDEQVRVRRRLPCFAATLRFDPRCRSHELPALRVSGRACAAPTLCYRGV